MGPCVLTMSTDRTVDAEFNLPGIAQRTLTITGAGSGNGNVDRRSFCQVLIARSSMA